MTYDKGLLLYILYILYIPISSAHQSAKQYHHMYTYKSSMSGDSLVTLSLVAFWGPSSTTNERYTYDDATMSWHIQLTTINISIPYSALKLLACLHQSKPNSREVDPQTQDYLCQPLDCRKGHI